MITKAVSSLKLGSSLESYAAKDLIPALGREYPTGDAQLQLSTLLDGKSTDAIRDLAVTISQRGFCVFRDQDITLEQHKLLVQQLGEVTNKPKTSTLYPHPLNHTDGDPEVQTFSRSMSNTDPGLKARTLKAEKTDRGAGGWHTDIPFENVTPDYSALQMKVAPTSGGDTCFASAYAVYDRLSPAMQQFLETLSATFQPVGYVVDSKEAEMYSTERGSPENTGQALTANHPVVRTHPVTGKKTVFAIGHHVQYINGLSKSESRLIIDMLLRQVTDNADSQTRVSWKKNDVVIWDNRAVYHSATYDTDQPRSARRVVGIGEKPYLE